MAERKWKVRTPVDADWEKHPLIEGKVVSIEVLPDTNPPRRFMKVDDGDTIWRIYESAGLKEAFESAEAGDGIKCEFVETVKLEGNKTFNRYNCRLWSN